MYPGTCVNVSFKPLEVVAHQPNDVTVQKELVTNIKQKSHD